MSTPRRQGLTSFGLRIGSMRHRVTIMRPPRPDETDEMGQPITEWQPVETRWAEVRDMVGHRLWAAQQVHAEARTEVRMRWTDKVRPGMRIVHGDRVLEIIGAPADPDGRRRELVCTCREVI